MKLEKLLMMVLCAFLAVLCGCGTTEPGANQDTVDVESGPGVSEETTSEFPIQVSWETEPTNPVAVTTEGSSVSADDFPVIAYTKSDGFTEDAVAWVAEVDVVNSAGKRSTMTVTGELVLADAVGTIRSSKDSWDTVVLLYIAFEHLRGDGSIRFALFEPAPNEDLQPEPHPNDSPSVPGHTPSKDDEDGEPTRQLSRWLDLPIEVSL